jgi:predicted aspartyl protease
MQGQAMLADGSIQTFDVYRVIVDWDGQPRDLEAISSGPTALIGVLALQGHDLRIEVVPGGRVEIEARP